MKRHIQKLAEYVDLFIDTNTGLAFVEDGKLGCVHTAHPNIDATGSVAGMRKLGYWGQKDRVIRCIGAIHNIDRCVVTDKYDEIAAQHCRCGGKHPEKTHG